MNPVLSTWLTCVLAAAGPAEDPAPWLARVRENSAKWEVARRDPSRGWTLETLTELLDGDRVKERETERMITVRHHGHPFQRLVEINGKPLEGKAAAEAQKAEEEFKAKAARAKPGDRVPMANDHVVLNADVMSRYDFKVLGREQRGGRNCVVIGLKGKGGGGIGAKPRDIVVRRIEGKAWIDEEDGALVHLEAGLPETVSIGLGAIKVEVVDLSFTQEQLEPGLWAPRQFRLLLRGRAFVKRLDRRFHMDWTHARIPAAAVTPPPAEGTVAPPPDPAGTPPPGSAAPP